MNRYAKFVVLCALFSVAAASYFEAIPKVVMDECLKANSVTLDEITKAALEAASSHSDSPESHYCFLKCLETKENVIGQDGAIDIDKLKESSKVKVMEDGKRAKLVECMSKIDKKINACSDMKLVSPCYFMAM